MRRKLEVQKFSITVNFSYRQNKVKRTLSTYNLNIFRNLLNQISKYFLNRCTLSLILQENCQHNVRLSKFCFVRLDPGLKRMRDQFCTDPRLQKKVRSSPSKPKSIEEIVSRDSTGPNLMKQICPIHNYNTSLKII